METLFEQLIVDFHERPLPDLTKRKVALPALPGKIDAVIGMRRTGKTWFLFQAMQRYLSEGVPKEAMLYLNFDDERLLPMQETGLRHGTIVSLDTEDRIDTPAGEIEVVPAWWWALRV